MTREEKLQYDRDWRKKNKEKHAAYQRKYWHKHNVTINARKSRRGSLILKATKKFMEELIGQGLSIVSKNNLERPLFVWEYRGERTYERWADLNL